MVPEMLESEISTVVPGAILPLVTAARKSLNGIVFAEVPKGLIRTTATSATRAMATQVEVRGRPGPGGLEPSLLLAGRRPNGERSLLSGTSPSSHRF